MKRIATVCLLILPCSSAAHAAVTTSVSSSPTVNLPGFVTDTITATVAPGEKIIGFDFVSAFGKGYGITGPMNQVNPAGVSTVFADHNAIFPLFSMDETWDSQFIVQSWKGITVQPSESANSLKAAFSYYNQYIAADATNTWSFVQIAHAAEVNYKGTLTVKNAFGVYRLELISGVLPAVPEPSASALIAGGAVAALCCLRRRRSVFAPAIMLRYSLVGFVFFTIARAGHAASVPIVNVDPSGPCPTVCLNEPHGDITWGWTFYVTEPIAITHVGWYDQDGDGLSHLHRIGIWRDLTGETNWPYVDGTPQQILGTFPPFVTDGLEIPAGTAAELDGPWRKVPINAIPPGTPFVLQPGGYAVGGLDHPNSTDAIRYTLAGGATPNLLTSDPRIIIGAPSYSSQSGFRVPDIFILVHGVEMGPMLFAEPVPEPSRPLLLAAGAFAALGRPRYLRPWPTRM
jgi:hypothetical protein